MEGFRYIIARTRKLRLFIKYLFFSTFIALTSNFLNSRTSVRFHLLAPVIAYRFHVASEELKSIKDAVDFSFGFSFRGVSVKPYQVRDEIYGLCRLIYDIKPKVILEIGTANGGTLFLWSRIADNDAVIISVDLPGGMFGGGYPRWRIPLYKSFAKKNQKIYLIRADSHDPLTLEKVKRILNARKIDFLFIDGDHTYEGVRKDFEMYSPLVRNGGAIAFHDIVPGPPERVGGIPKFWGKVKEKYKRVEIVMDWGQNGYGIGVIYL